MNSRGMILELHRILERELRHIHRQRRASSSRAEISDIGQNNAAAKTCCRRHVVILTKVA